MRICFLAYVGNGSTKTGASSCSRKPPVAVREACTGGGLPEYAAISAPPAIEQPLKSNRAGALISFFSTLAIWLAFFCVNCGRRG
eukprot:CAMPEP_0167780964 /NCGR_PEP_ID=MMETSP0111_2-20121227/5660_1 /TAXON_ID=91324 /ORGANISM="Lotharella globosa, Strain CCCM811" /LENGTH=84 /DNA_ID=CAMNT_0007671555 /DNA_START=1185 /DNA_END=1435 /DNA_ORIENTATION=-